VPGGRQCSDSFWSFAAARGPHIAVNIIFKGGSGNGYCCLGYADHIRQTRRSWDMKVLLVKLKTLGPEFFLSGFAFGRSECNYTGCWACDTSNGLSNLSSSYNAPHTNCHVMTVCGLISEATYSLCLSIEVLNENQRMQQWWKYIFLEIYQHVSGITMPIVRIQI
jgi:hypothetical protein